MAALIGLVAASFVAFHSDAGGPRWRAAASSTLRVVRSAFDEKNPELLAPLPEVEMTRFPTAPTEAVLAVNSSLKYQEILGFGGAFTEATALGWKSLSPEDQAKVLHMFFGDPSEGGHGFTMGRVPIGTTDFSKECCHSFDEAPGDVHMKHFDRSAKHDEDVGILPMMRAANQIVRARGYDLRITASPWSPPAWMKLPKDGKRTMIGSPKPNGLDPQYQRAYAKYFSAFVDTYKTKGIDIWAVTVQNEPENPAEWEGCLYTPEFMASFIRDHLGPALHEDHPGLKILTYDHNKDHMVKWGEVMYQGDPAVRGYLNGMAVHWYGGLNTAHLDAVHNMAPEMLILPTEACNCDGVTYRPDNAMKWWQRAEDIALDVLADLKHWANGYVVWNLIVDTEGGPNHAQNVCDADVIADPHSKMGLGTVIVQATYFLGGHFSRFIPPGSRLVGLTNAVSTKPPPVNEGDIAYGFLVLEPCKDDPDGKAVQTWVYSSHSTFDYPGVDLAFKVLGLCACIVNGDESNGAVLYVMKCQYGHGEALRLQEVNDGTSNSFHIYDMEVYDNKLRKCLTSRLARGSDIGMDKGVQILVVEMYECVPGALNQTFQLVRVSDGGECKAGDECRMIAGYPHTDSPMCVQPQLVRRPHFDAAAFETPSGDISVVALNLGDESIKYTLYDTSSGYGASDLEMPPHSMVSYTLASASKAVVDRFDTKSFRLFASVQQTIAGGAMGQLSTPFCMMSFAMASAAFGCLLGSLAWRLRLRYCSSSDTTMAYHQMG